MKNLITPFTLLHNQLKILLHEHYKVTNFVAGKGVKIQSMGMFRKPIDSKFCSCITNRSREIRIRSPVGRLLTESVDCEDKPTNSRSRNFYQKLNKIFGIFALLRVISARQSDEDNFRGYVLCSVHAALNIMVNMVCRMNPTRQCVSVNETQYLRVSNSQTSDRINSKW